MGLTLLSVAAVDKEDLVIPAAYRAGTFPATTEKVRALGTLRVESGFLGHDLELGVWFIKAIVIQRNLAEKRRPVVVFPHRVTCPEQGTLEIRTTVMSEGQCIKVGFRIQRTEEPGQYTTFSGHKVFYIYELLVRNHYILYTETFCLRKISKTDTS
ncbi:vomeronasal secretory protein 2 [Cricetulus griseus]|nr:vomeronasal secretory protein 2 [Cricetulus griseus]